MKATRAQLFFLLVLPGVIKEYSLNRDGPISSVKLFSLNPGQAHKPGGTL